MNTTRRSVRVWGAVIAAMTIAVWSTWPSYVLRPLRALGGEETSFLEAGSESHQFFIPLPCARVHSALEESRNALAVSPSLHGRGTSEEDLLPKDGGGCHVYIEFRREPGWLQEAMARVRERFWPERMIY